MSTIFCRLLFHDFCDVRVHEFIKLINEVSFQTATDLSFQPPVAMYSDLSENNAEAQFSFTLKTEAAEGRRLQKKERYHQICLALCELSKEFESLRKAFFEQGLSNSATVSMTILSRNIYPQYFELQNVFSMDKLAFGSINNRQYFAPTFIFNEPTNERKEHEVFEQYLHEQRDLEDIGSNMLICFEHDRECFTVCFPDIIMRTDESTVRSINRVIDIRVSYAAIRRVIVSMETTQSNEIKATFTFQLNHPPTLLVYQMHDEQKGFKPPQRFLTWNPGYDVQNAMSNASCLVASCRLIDARILLDCFDRLRKSNNYAIEFRFLRRKELKNIQFYGRDPFANPNYLPPKYSKLKELKYFPLVYAVQALISRGGELFDYFFRPEYFKFYEFLDAVVECYDEDLSTNPGAKMLKTIIALENMLLEVDKAYDIVEPLSFFWKLYSDSSPQILADVTDDLAREGYMRVRKIIVTPTRKLFINPELIMGNRSLRKEGDNMLRIIFRDDDNNKIYALPYKLISKTVTRTLTNPLHIGSREFHYLCSSNSQLRDHGCYFLAGPKDYVSEFRRSCGRIDSKSIPRIMSRLGQCFTQSRPLGIKVERGSYSGIFDYTGGNDSNGNPYIFSDGCGMISREFGQKIVRDMNLGDCLPSCFQIRFRGFKGVVAVNTLLDETKIWAQKHNRVSAFQKDALLPWYCQSLLFRPSQKKFRGPRSEPVEIVKFSTPISLSLNKPLINILDQVSEMHGPEQHKRMCNRIFELMEYHLESTISSLVDKSNAFVTLNEFPQYILYDRLYDFDVTEEPFFRSLLRSAALSSLYRLVDKMKIRIPTSQGRMMFGVIDETGFLQYGQVFIQYTSNFALKFPTQHAKKVIHKGPVMITKNPSLVAGDVRMFEAVDIPSLHDLVDVVVFPQHGPRPHSDEMSGSDLDGDEYSIFFDPMLFLDHNEPAFDYTPKKSKISTLSEIDIEKNLTKHMIDFFTLYISQDSIGAIANSHLANSDLYGINSKHCHNIALKHNQAVDFSKSGQVPDELTRTWDRDLPPEKVERFPDFMCKGHASSYKSDRLLGNLFSRAMEVREIIRTEEYASMDEKIKLDESVLMPGDEIYEYIAQSAYDEYRTLIGSICERYGIANEAQLFSSRFTGFKKRFADKGDDKIAVFNMLKEQIAVIYAKFRSNFFDDFGGIKKNTELDERKFNGIREPFRRICSFPSDEIRKKASAYYRIAYNNGKFLSFAWLAYDVLTYNRQKYLLKTGNFKLSLCPIIDYLSNYINDFCKSRMFLNEFDAFCKSLRDSYSSKRSSEEVSYYVAKMCHIFNGLDKLLFIFRKWIIKHGIAYDPNNNNNEKSIHPKLMDAIVVLYGIGELKKGNGGWLTDFYAMEDCIVNLEEHSGGIGKMFWNLIQFLMTRNFGFSERISMKPVAKKYLEPSQCRILYFAAENTFYPLAVNRRFDCLPGTLEDQKTIQKVTEGSVFILEIPRSCVNYEQLFGQLALKCDCKYLVVRKKPDHNPKSFRVALKPVGSFIAIRKFRNLLNVVPCMTELDLQKRSEMIATELYKRLQFYSEEGRSIEDEFVP